MEKKNNCAINAALLMEPMVIKEYVIEEKSHYLFVQASISLYFWYNRIGN
jgi:hypothetical protein